MLYVYNVDVLSVLIVLHTCTLKETIICWMFATFTIIIIFLRFQYYFAVMFSSHVIVLGDVNTSHRTIDHCDPTDIVSRAL